MSFPIQIRCIDSMTDPAGDLLGPIDESSERRSNTWSHAALSCREIKG